VPPFAVSSQQEGSSSSNSASDARGRGDGNEFSRAEGEGALNRSLSSAFFKSRSQRQSSGFVGEGESDQQTSGGAVDSGSSAAVVPSHSRSNAASALALEKKKREAVASLAVMKERLRSMGILTTEKTITPDGLAAAVLDNDAIAAAVPSVGQDDLVPNQDRLKNIKSRIGARVLVSKSLDNSKLAPPLPNQGVLAEAAATNPKDEDARAASTGSRTPETVSEEGDDDEHEIAAATSSAVLLPLVGQQQYPQQQHLNSSSIIPTTVGAVDEESELLGPLLAETASITHAQLQRLTQTDLARLLREKTQSYKNVLRYNDIIISLYAGICVKSILNHAILFVFLLVI
jgi:hypothetical protein